jgi:hypothetical protein
MFFKHNLFEMEYLESVKTWCRGRASRLAEKKKIRFENAKDF